MFTIRAATATRCGSGRIENQDRWWVGHRRAAIADGMGGHRAGAVAAQIAVDTLAALGPSTTSADLVRGFWIANHTIRDDARAHPERASMGTTLVALEVIDRGGGASVTIASVGDCRLYRLRQGVLWRVTVDHTWEAELLGAGVDPAAARRSRHVLTRSLGSDDVVNVDVWELDAQGEDGFLLCSDGTWGPLEDSTIAALWQQAAAGSEAEDIVAAAVAAGGRDDATAIVIELVPLACGAPAKAHSTGILAVGRVPEGRGLRRPYREAGWEPRRQVRGSTGAFWS